ncbi:GNAT family N-acetyltransferase [Ruegeria arenilitoris]|uniref:GNAT family N-acetyltransferase n=1 Tax=Ruegeria arenilitoris TaxID=1173585 RepID=UPI00147D5F75|nr:GNAT family N-acetyltransferase [Ruegeria arenilitoris]
MKIRHAQPADSASITQITNTSIRDSLATFTTEVRQPESIAADIEARSGYFLVAEEEGKVLGFATYGPFRSGPGYAHTREHSIQLTPEARGRGIGRALMTTLENAAIENNVHVLVAGISSENPPAIAFHMALGFSEVGRMPQVGRKWGRWLDLVLMQKILASN